jgi:hypothetical protein
MNKLTTIECVAELLRVTGGHTPPDERPSPIPAQPLSWFFSGFLDWGWI